MTTTTETPATTRTCPPSAVVDRVGRFADRGHVADGDRIVHEGRWRTIERIGPHSIGGVETPGILRVVLDDGSAFRAHEDDLVAVRRYTEGISERDALVIAALDEAAADRDERARFARHEGRTDEEQEHTGRAAEYRTERDRREAGRD